MGSSPCLQVILLLDFPKQSFEWTDLQRLLSQWGLNQSQFVDACLLAGTEYCLTSAGLCKAGHGG